MRAISMRAGVAVSALLFAAAPQARAQGVDECVPLVTLKGGDQVILGVCVSGGVNSLGNPYANVSLYQQDSANSPKVTLYRVHDAVYQDEGGTTHDEGSVRGDDPVVFFDFSPAQEDTLQHQVLCVRLPDQFTPNQVCVLPQDIIHN